MIVETLVGLHVMRPFLLSHFNQNLNMSTNFSKTPEIKVVMRTMVGDRVEIH
jgi:hypothetical protein